jgi:hypothetical protein
MTQATEAQPTPEVAEPVDPAVPATPAESPSPTETPAEAPAEAPAAPEPDVEAVLAFAAEHGIEIDDVDYAVVKPPEGSKLDENTITRVREFAAEHGLDAEAAQALMDIEAGREAKQVEEWSGQVETMKSELAEKLGDQWDVANKRVTGALLHFGEPGKALMDALVEANLQYSPTVFGFLDAVAKAIGEPKSIGRGQPAAGPLSEEEEWERSYPKSPSLSALRNTM